VYSNVGLVKEVLRVDVTDTNSDAELTNCILSADALIDDILTRYDLSVPSAVPLAVVNAGKYFAAWFFRMRGVPPAEVKAFWEVGMTFLNGYLAAQEEQAVFVRQA